jgi:hypothetical protein
LAGDRPFLLSSSLYIVVRYARSFFLSSEYGVAWLVGDYKLYRNEHFTDLKSTHAERKMLWVTPIEEFSTLGAKTKHSKIPVWVCVVVTKYKRDFDLVALVKSLNLVNRSLIFMTWMRALAPTLVGLMI